MSASLFNVRKDLFKVIVYRFRSPDIKKRKIELLFSKYIILERYSDCKIDRLRLRL